MTDVEKYIYTTRKSEFFNMIYHSKPIATLYRRQYDPATIIIYKNAYHIKTKHNDIKELYPIPLENMDYMAHLYASYQLHKLRELIEDDIKPHPYLSEHIKIELINTDHKFYYSNDTHAYFQICELEGHAVI